MVGVSLYFLVGILFCLYSPRVFCSNDVADVVLISICMRRLSVFRVGWFVMDGGREGGGREEREGGRYFKGEG